MTPATSICPKQYASAVADQVCAFLDSVPITSSYRSALTAAMSVPSNALSNAPDMRWARLVWTCCIAAGGCWKHAMPIAAAVELFMVALDVLDDEEDGEATSLRADLGFARTLNVSTGLLFLAQRGLLRADYGTTATNLLLNAGLRACSGQHADLAPQTERPADLDEALTITASKSASLVATICQLGALCAGADESTQVLYAHFGWYLGMAKQLTNDLADVHPDALDKTDVALDKPTLPLVYVALQAPSSGTYISAAERQAAIWTGGAAYLTWAVTKVYCRRAADMIPRLTADPTSCAELAALLPALS